MAKAVAGVRAASISLPMQGTALNAVDPSLTVEHIERITQLVIDICGTPETVAARWTTKWCICPQLSRGAARGPRCQGHWHAADASAMCGRLEAPGLARVRADGVITVTPPSYRFDIAIEEDLIEEVARMVGYNNLPTTPPLAPITPKLPAENAQPFAVRRLLAGLGYQETINFSFVEERWEHELAGNPTRSSCSTRLPVR